MPIARSRAGFYLVAEERLNQPGPGPLWLGEEPRAVAMFFDKMRADGFEFFPTSLNRMLMKAAGRPDRIVWLEREDGRKVALSTLLS